MDTGDTQNSMATTFMGHEINIIILVICQVLVGKLKSTSKELVSFERHSGSKEATNVYKKSNRNSCNFF